VQIRIRSSLFLILIKFSQSVNFSLSNQQRRQKNAEEERKKERKKEKKEERKETRERERERFRYVSSTIDRIETTED